MVWQPHLRVCQGSLSVHLKQDWETGCGSDLLFQTKHLFVEAEAHVKEQGDSTMLVVA